MRDKRMDCHQPHQILLLIWQTIAHCMSPLNTQHHSHIQAMRYTETDGCPFISTRCQCFSLRVNAGSAWGAYVWLPGKEV